VIDLQTVCKIAIRSKEKESLVFQNFIGELEEYHPALVAEAREIFP